MPSSTLTITTRNTSVSIHTQLLTCGCGCSPHAGVKSTALQNLIKQLQADDVPIDGVGFESHFIVGEVPTTLVENFQAYAALGLEFAITELDIRMELPATAELLEQQKQDYYTVVSACMAVSQCVGVTVWDWTDKVNILSLSLLPISS